MEKMVNKRLIWHLESSNIITKEQCGFRKNHSTIDILSTLHTDICNARNQKQHVILISFDLEKAYDMVWCNRVLKIIQTNGINGKMFLFLQNFLKNRKIQVRAHAELLKIHQTENGLPQGSVIRVTMFLLTINDIFKNIPKPTKHLLFADDCHIYCSRQNIKTTAEILQNSLDILHDWSLKTGFKFSAGKSQCITFHNRPNPNILLYLKSFLIPLGKHSAYLE
ncbi:Reverse transcriptase domain [Cinara cedri]|uniref:Reverse transcriptase domain n=1 Tax=Cinara cedri TaxID=506608 RepID=A0A5E4NL71_9HEMI|nr:Reverse transcriptase domain [Cinara cedri]